MNCNRLDTYASWRAVYWCNGNSVEMTRRPWSSRQKDALQGWVDGEDIPYLWACFCLGSQCVHHYMWFVFYILITVSLRILPLWQDKHLLNNSGPSPLIYVTVIHEFIPWCITRNQSTAHTSNQSSSLLSLNQVLVMYQPQLLWRQPPSPSVDAFEAYRWELQWSCSASENYCVRSKMDVKKASVSGEANINEETDGNTVTFEKDLIYSTPFHTIFLRPIEVVKLWYPVPWSVQHYDPSAIPEE